MKYKIIYLLILSAIFIYCADSSYSAAWYVDIDADYSYNDKEREVIIAKGNVKARAKDFYLESPYVKYYYKEDRIVAEDRFFIDIEGYRIYGSKLEYDFKKKEGVAGIIRINFGNSFLGGSYMMIKKDQLEIFNAYFTGCNKSDSDYHVAANELVLYPKTGLMIAYWATAWIGPAPVIPVPTFVYSTPVPPSKFVKKVIRQLTARERKLKLLEEKKHTQPVPEFASNTEDGWYIRQGFNWFFGPKWYAKMLIGYMERKNMGIGLKTNYIINEFNEGEVRLAQNAGDGGYGGLTHYMHIGPKIIPEDEEEWLIYDTYAQSGKYSYELEINQSFRERINLDENKGPFNRVSFLPKVTLKSNRKPLPYVGEPFSYYVEVNTAQVSEEPTYGSATYTESERKQFFADMSYDTDVWILGKFKASVDYNTIEYPTVKQFWQLATQRLEIKHKYYDAFELKLGHLHYIQQAGNGSPFAFERYEFSPFDQLISGIKLNYWWSTFTVDSVHNLPKMDPFSINYGLVLGLHCYDLVFGYKIIFGPPETTEFSFTFDLAQSRWLEK